MKKTGVLICCIACLVGMLSAAFTASAAEVMLQYTSTGDGTAQITGYTGYPVAIGIPSKAGEWTVNGIGNAAFEGCQSLERIVLPDTVQSIGIRAFAECPLLADITLPDGIRHIGADAFKGTAYYDDPDNWNDQVLYLDGVLLAASPSAGHHVVIQNGTKTVAQRAFIDVPDIQAVVVPASVTYIDEEAFDGCGGVELYMFMDATYAIEYAKTNGFTYGIIADLVKDNHIDMMDALYLYTVTSAGELPDSMQYTADFNCDGTVNMMDCLQLYTSISG